MKREHQINFWYVIIAMFTVLMLPRYYPQKGHIKESLHSRIVLWIAS